MFVDACIAGSVRHIFRGPVGMATVWLDPESIMSALPLFIYIINLCLGSNCFVVRPLGYFMTNV